MKFINYLIDTTNDSYDCFEDFMSGIFERVYVEPEHREKDESEIPNDQDAQ